MATGYAMAFPTVLTAALTGDHCDDVCSSNDEASWIAACYNITGVLSFFILPHLMQAYGRRFTNIIINAINIVGFLFIANAPNIAILVAGRYIQGLGLCGLLLNCVISAEYCHPRKRGFLITLVGCANCVGILACHGLGFILGWRQTAYVGILPGLLGALSTILWPESPSWLAYKARYEECEAVFALIRSNDSEMKKELSELIAAQKEIRKMRTAHKNLISYLFTTFTSKDFLKPLAILTLLLVLAQVCGFYYLLAYVQQIMEKLTDSSAESIYFTLGLDLFKVLSFFVTCVFMKQFNIRTILFSSGTIACVLLAFLCIFDLLEWKDILHVKWLTPLILISYNTVCHIGVMPVYIMMLGEIFPLEYKSIGISCVGIIYSATGYLTLKFTATMLDKIKVYGTFSVYLLVSVFCLLCLYFTLPETKDRTLQNIEFDFIDVHIEDEDVAEVMVKKNEYKVVCKD